MARIMGPGLVIPLGAAFYFSFEIYTTSVCRPHESAAFAKASTEMGQPTSRKREMT